VAPQVLSFDVTVSAPVHPPFSRDCAAITDLAVAWVDGVLRGDARAQVAAHLSSCASCRTALEQDAALRRRLRAIAPERAPATLRAAIEGLRRSTR
jgi:anti-sigma factor RsiW